MRALSGVNELWLELQMFAPCQLWRSAQMLLFLRTSPDPDLDCHSLDFPWQPKDHNTSQMDVFFAPNAPTVSHFIFSLLYLTAVLSTDALRAGAVR